MTGVTPITASPTSDVDGSQVESGAHQLPKRFRKHLLAENLLSKGSAVVVGVSGRSDSVALLHLLQGIAAELNLRLVITHVQHGEDPERVSDANFVHDLAERLNLQFDLFVDDEPAPDESSRATTRARHFERVRARVHAGATTTGETLDHSAEKFLEALVRDDAMPHVRRRPDEPSVRPLLPFTHEECRTFLTGRGLEFLRDPNALSPKTTRKKLRLLILPLLRRHVEHSALENLAAASRLLADDEDVLREIAKAARSETGWTQTESSVSLDHHRWSALPAALRRRLLAEAANSVSAPLSRSELLDLDARCRSPHPDHPATVGTLNITLTRGMLFLSSPELLAMRSPNKAQAVTS